MTFARFEEIFKSRYPDGTVFAHGVFAGTHKNMKTTVEFVPNGKVYSYYGPYDSILCKMGIMTISKEHLAELEIMLEDRKRTHGDRNMFFTDVWRDNTKEIMELEARIAKIRREYIIA